MNKKWMVIGLLLLGSTLQAGANLPYPPLPPLYTSEEYEKITSSSSTKSPAPIQSTDDSADLPYPPFPNQEEGSNEDASSNKRKRTPSPVTTSPQILPAEIITTQNQQSASSSAIPQLKTKFECPYCEKGQKTFPDNPELTNHIKNNHTGERAHICPYQTCDKVFDQQGNLRRHTRLHTREKPYLCEICNRSFTQRNNLTTHTRTHTGEKPYPCPTCNSKFTKYSSLIRHTRTHTGEKPFECSTCEKKFTEKGNLIKHIRTHTGENPYLCKICNRSFTDKSNLTKHTRTQKHLKAQAARDLLQGDNNE